MRSSTSRLACRQACRQACSTSSLPRSHSHLGPNPEASSTLEACGPHTPASQHRVQFGTLGATFRSPMHATATPNRPPVVSKVWIFRIWVGEDQTPSFGWSNPVREDLARRAGCEFCIARIQKFDHALSRGPLAEPLEYGFLVVELLGVSNAELLKETCDCFDMAGGGSRGRPL